MRRRDLCAPHSVYELQPGNGATFVVGAQYNATKNPIAQNSRYRKTDTIPLLLEFEGRLLFFAELRLNISINARQHRRSLRESKLEYSIEIVG
ncbi:hypothetical protein BF49_1059 [Bradyrhizobium sp.]|nr:hypothetical protein BF49_1059 [Bradyrhizobium sp.]